MLGRAERPGRYDVGPEREDPDEKAAFLVARGYAPGTIYQLQQQLGDVEAAAQGEREKIGKAAKRAESIHRAQQAGRLDVSPPRGRWTRATRATRARCACSSAGRRACGPRSLM